MEEAYHQFLQRLILKRLRVASALAIILVPSGSVLLDYFIYPEYVRTFLPLRLACTILSVIVLLVSYTKVGEYYPTGLGIFETSNVAIMIAMMIQYLGYETPYYAGLNLIILAIGVVFPWGVRETLLTCGLIYSYYLVPSLLRSPITNLHIFLNNNIFMLQTILITVAASYFSSSLRRNDFEGRYQLEKTGEALKASKQALSESYEKLQEYDRAKSRFFANISHELRTPTTFILGPVQMLIDRELGEVTSEQEKYLRVIYRNATRLLNIINKLLDLMRSESGAAELICQRDNFVKFVEEIVHAVVPVAEKKSLTLSFSGDATIPSFFFDADKIEDVIYNLLSNAIKFTQKGNVFVSCSEQYGSVLVKVTDTGCGIPANDLEKVFERFYQVDNEASRVGMGTGIGLALVKDWVQLHGGRIWVESEEGKGSTFSFTIPIQTQERIDRPRLRKSGEERRERERRRILEQELALDVVTPQEPLSQAREGVKRILIVDDIPDMLNFISDQLKGDYDLCFARDGAEGIHLARTANPDLIISDVMMPVKDGYQLCRELKGDPETTSIPIILLTAKGSLTDKIEGLEEGADDYLTKPFNREELKVRVRTLMRTRRLQKELQVVNKQLEDSLSEIRRVGCDLAQSEKMAALGLLISGVAHELNNPISFSQGALLVVRKAFDKIALDSNAFSEMRHDIIDSLDILKSGLSRVEGVVKALSSFIRKDEALFTMFDLQAGLEVTLGLLKYEWGERITVNRHYDERPIFIEAISGQINQVFMNIFQNAYQAMGGSGTIDVTTRLMEGAVSISIRDTGVGMSQETISKIFEPFFTTKEVGKGTGLGLSLVYRMVVETHHGKIDVKSEVGKGAEFMITLPLTQPVRGTVDA